MLAEAIRFAQRAHAEQVDKGGQPFIGHPLRVLARMSLETLAEQTLTAAVLHDVVEDCGVQLDELAERFGPRVADLVGALTQRSGETYFDYVRRVRAFGGVAARIKLADLADNADERRGYENASLAERYEKAVEILRFNEA